MNTDSPHLLPLAVRLPILPSNGRRARPGEIRRRQFLLHRLKATQQASERSTSGSRLIDDVRIGTLALLPADGRKGSVCGRAATVTTVTIVVALNRPAAAVAASGDREWLNAEFAFVVRRRN